MEGVVEVVDIEVDGREWEDRVCLVIMKSGESFTLFEIATLLVVGGKAHMLIPSGVVSRER